MGNPHAVALLESEEEVEALDLGSAGPPVERDPLFPERTNVEFVYVRGEQEVRMRVWERGAGETLASGSGSCAAAVAAVPSRARREPCARAARRRHRGRVGRGRGTRLHDGSCRVRLRGVDLAQLYKAVAGGEEERLQPRVHP